MNRTKTIKIGKEDYCVYCGNKSISDVDYYNHGREEDHYEKCNCEELKQVKERETTIRNLQIKLDNFIKDLDKKNMPKFNELEFDYKLKKLKDEYEQD